MAIFPNISQPGDVSEQPVKSQIKSTFENGAVLSRPRYSRRRSKFSLSWNALPEDEYQELLEFFDANQGLTFTWMFIVGDKTYQKTVRFSGDDMGTWRFVGPGLRSGSISIEEA